MLKTQLNQILTFIKRILISRDSPVVRGCLHEISFRAKWNIFILMFAQSFVTVYKTHPEMKLITGVVSLRIF